MHMPMERPAGPKGWIVSRWIFWVNFSLLLTGAINRNQSWKNDFWDICKEHLTFDRPALLVIKNKNILGNPSQSLHGFFASLQKLCLKSVLSLARSKERSYSKIVTKDRSPQIKVDLPVHRAESVKSEKVLRRPFSKMISRLDRPGILLLKNGGLRQLTNFTRRPPRHKPYKTKLAPSWEIDGFSITFISTVWPIRDMALECAPTAFLRYPPARAYEVGTLTGKYQVSFAERWPVSQLGALFKQQQQNLFPKTRNDQISVIHHLTWRSSRTPFSFLWDLRSL